MSVQPIPTPCDLTCTWRTLSLQPRPLPLHFPAVPGPSQCLLLDVPVALPVGEVVVSEGEVGRRINENFVHRELESLKKKNAKFAYVKFGGDF